MSETIISDIQLAKSNDEFSPDDNTTINVKFSITGELRNSFTEKNWTDAYDQNDNTIKLKYGVKLSKGGIRKHDLSKPIDTYRKASIFWTRNPKLVNPMKERRIWVQVAKNFEPFIRLTEEEVQQELFDFDEQIMFSASELGKGVHKISASVSASWHTHAWVQGDNEKIHSEEIEININ